MLDRRDIVYQEYLAFDSLPQAVATWCALGAFRTALRWRWARWLLGRLASPGGKQADAQADDGSYDLHVIGTSADGRRTSVKVRGDGDAGNRITILCACECALALAAEEMTLPGTFGVLTLSIALRDALVTRLRAAGLRIDIDEVE